MADKLMYIPNDFTQNYPFFRLQMEVKKGFDTHLNEPINQLRQRIRKRYHKILGTSVINSPMSPSCLHIIIQQKYICLHLATTVFQDWILFACLSFWCFILK